ncbi:MULTISPECIES: FadR/GntR family transcriptional regulator [unclassified Nocardioides]|uniref:FadR/GntR family transcriptional regulator n=1 Tax=unclassified Nocardioides TaxID=2615069 RepID=UPI0026654C09|nr:GntR family transcriptional regulator [Nocardioides sp. Arc9.136]WKN49492.1 GntR family transcriptional regulator [Nocardioides sp. Arc9.136]
MSGDESRRLPPLRRERLYESLAAHISDFIEAQGLVGGDRLPPERQLAAELGVSRATLSRALAALETRGRIEVRHGVGALVREPEPVGAPAGPGWADRIGERPRSEVLVAREAVLAGMARVAAGADSALRMAMLAPDGRQRSFDHTWRCVRRLSGDGLLAELDEVLAAHAPGPPDSPAVHARLDRLAEAVLRGDAAAAATACQGILDA